MQTVINFNLISFQTRMTVFRQWNTTDSILKNTVATKQQQQHSPPRHFSKDLFIK